MKIRLAQINTRVVDFDGNLKLITDACDRARANGDHMVLTPELALTGYPPLDLLERPQVLLDAVNLLPQLAEASRDLVLIVGVALPATYPGLVPSLRQAINAAVVFENRQMRGIVRKRLLPTYDVFDEDRYFQPGNSARIFELCGRRVGVTICEDIWSHDEHGPPRYDVDPVGELATLGADCIVNLSASPFDVGKAARRLELVRRIAGRHGLPIAYCNLVGGNDSILFDGRSFAIDGHGEVIAVAPAFQSSDLTVDLPHIVPQNQLRTRANVPPPFAPPQALEVRAALVMGVRDYVTKCGFRDVILGLSGGIDSALVAAIAVEALGHEHVSGFALPGPYSSEGSITDAIKLAKALEIRCPIISIGDMYRETTATMAAEFQHFDHVPYDVTDQNIQARLRGVVLMAVSNKSGAMLLTTGNKSELAVGYCTLYGDMSGGLAVIGDVPKLLVYEIAKTYNKNREIIPLATLTKPPSAELAPDQKDSDALPPYAILDEILELHVVERLTPTEIAERGFDLTTIKRVVRLTELSEYKRRQAAPVLRVTRKAFGGGRRIPMARKLPT